MSAETALHLNQVTVAVRDVRRSVEFYRGLGLVPIVDGEDYARMMTPGNGATLSFHRVDSAVDSDTRIYFECEELDAKVAALGEDGYVFEMEPTDQRWLWREARLRDPDGHPLCLFRAGENRLNPPWRVGAAEDATRPNAMAEVRATVEKLIAAGSSYRVDELERLYHHRLRITKIDETGEVSSLDRDENLEFFRQQREEGAPPLSTEAEFNHVEAMGDRGQVIVTRRMQMGARPEKSIFSLYLLHEDGRWQIERETAFVQPLEVGDEVD